MLFPSTAPLRSDDVVLVRTKIVLKGTAEPSLTVEEVPNPRKRDDRNPTYYRLVFDQTDEVVRVGLYRAVAGFLNGGTSALRQWALGDREKIDDLSPLGDRLSGDIYITQPHPGSHLHVYYFPHHPRCPYDSIHYQVNANELGIIKKWQPAVAAA